MSRILLLTLTVSALVCVALAACPSIPSSSCSVFPQQDEWNRVIENDPVDYMSDCYIGMYAQVCCCHCQPVTQVYIYFKLIFFHIHFLNHLHLSDRRH